MRPQQPPDPDDFADKLHKTIAGETINWYMFERYIELARPKTLSTLMRVQKTEAYMEAAQDKILTPGMKIALGTIIIIVFVAIIVIYMMRSMNFF